jgi:hypothetical protein
MGHLAWGTTGLTEATERAITVINGEGFEAVMTRALECNASIFKDASCRVTRTVWGMRRNFGEEIFGKLYCEDRQEMEE